MSMQYSKAVAEQKSIDNILKELTFKRSHLLTQATNAKMEIDSYQKRLDEVKRNIELYTPKDANKLEYSPKPWPVLKLVSGPTPNGQSSSRYTSEHTELGDAPLLSLPPFLSPPRIRREVMTYREFMRKYHQWSPGTNIEKNDEIEEFEDDKPSTAPFQVPPAVPSIVPSVLQVPATAKSPSSVSKKITWVDDDSDDETVTLSLTQAQVTSPPAKRALEETVAPGAPKKTKLTTEEKKVRRSMCSLVCEECGRKPCIIAFSATDTLMPHMCAYNSPLE